MVVLVRSRKETSTCGCGRMWRGLAVMLAMFLMGSVNLNKVNIEGELVVELRVPKTTATMEPFTIRMTPQVKILRAKSPDNVTVATPKECVYQYPESNQLEALLSDMMNQLTKMYVRVHRYMTSRAVRRQVGGSSKRFDIVATKKTGFFDTIYHNMTEEYRRFFNEQRALVLHGRDPCRHQDEIKDMWRTLLNTSQLNLQRAAMQCVEEYMRQRTVADSIRDRALTMILTEMSRVRSDQLTLLCDKFKLCYHDLG